MLLRDHAAVCGSSHGGQHGSEPGITAEDLKDHKAFVGTSAGAQAVRHGNGAGDTGAEADTVVSARNIVVPWSWEWRRPSRLPDKGELHSSACRHHRWE